MLAQTPGAAHSAATHESGNANPAASLVGKPGKKSRGEAGAFSDILSQAQKTLPAKASAHADGQKARGADAESLAAPHDKSETSRLRSAHERKAKNGRASDVAEGSGHKAEPAEPAKGVGPETAKAFAGAQAAQAGQGFEARERRGTRGADAATEASESEAVVTRTSPDRRKLKDKRDSSSEDTVAAAAASAPKPAIAGVVRGKASAQGESDSAIEKKPERISSEPKLTVLDLRRSAEARREASKADEAPKDAAREPKSVNSDSGREAVRELVLDARSSSDASSSRSGKAESAPARSQDFQAMMAERMRDAWNGEIVQSAHIVLRDGDAGTIRLRLRPESLGNVKIELNLSENNISGRIIVESDEAKSAFEKNMNELADAFKQGGFDSARLEVSVGGGGASAFGAGGNASSDSSRGDARGPFFSDRLRGALLSTADPATAVSAYARRGGSVDILA